MARPDRKARAVNHGEIWNYDPFLHTVMVAPITSTRRGLPSEVPVGIDEGLRRDSAVNLDHVQTG